MIVVEGPGSEKVTVKKLPREEGGVGGGGEEDARCVCVVSLDRI